MVAGVPAVTAGRSLRALPIRIHSRAVAMQASEPIGHHVWWLPRPSPLTAVFVPPRLCQLTVRAWQQMASLAPIVRWSARMSTNPASFSWAVIWCSASSPGMAPAVGWR